uniref:Putative secreted protein n=1 Tax=Anopheles darlingi TaxID=43151 RepID=A0A2M4D5D2_ANODA
MRCGVVVWFGVFVVFNEISHSRSYRDGVLLGITLRFGLNVLGVVSHLVTDLVSVHLWASTVGWGRGRNGRREMEKRNKM